MYLNDHGLDWATLKDAKYDSLNNTLTMLNGFDNQTFQIINTTTLKATSPHHEYEIYWRIPNQTGMEYLNRSALDVLHRQYKGQTIMALTTPLQKQLNLPPTLQIKLAKSVNDYHAETPTKHLGESVILKDIWNWIGVPFNEKNPEQLINQWANDRKIAPWS